MTLRSAGEGLQALRADPGLLAPATQPGSPASAGVAPASASAAPAQTAAAPSPDPAAAAQASGLSAREVDISPHTVKRHVAHILEKLALESRRQAAAWWMRR